jgi:MOSC domain-containing protein YiiM
VGHVHSVNVGRAEPNPFKGALSTGIGKRPQDHPVEIRDPGPKQGGLGSGLVGDFIGDVDNHGGRDQAVYAYAREDLDEWQRRLGRELADGCFGENLTTSGLDVNGARLGERWRVGSTVELVVTCPRIPCGTFRGWMDEAGWLKTFTAAARPGAYLAVAVPGAVRRGDAVTLLHRPSHDVDIALTFRALTTQRELRPRLAEAGDDLIPELREATVLS